jgi:phosphatidylserine/phosphatidylglycerophosphate/cardiolipin synthase-like enzyme
MQFTWYVLPIFPILFLTRKRWVSLPIYTYTYYSDLSLSIPMSPYTNGFESQHTLVHAKLFIIDEELAYVGSVNFTKAAFLYNYESRIKLTQKDIVVKLSQEFSYVYSNKNTEYLNISDMGKRIYSEPKN